MCTTKFKSDHIKIDVLRGGQNSATLPELLQESENMEIKNV